MPHPSSDEIKKWYVAYTYPKAERKVKTKLDTIGIQSFLPMHQVVRAWSDRNKKLTIPLFPNYIFIHISETKRHETFLIKEIIRYVSFEGKPATVHDATIDSLKKILNNKVEIDVENYIKEGTRVKINRGPFTGIEGIVAERNGKTRLIIHIKALQRSVAINISAGDVEPPQHNFQFSSSNPISGQR